MQLEWNAKTKKIAIIGSVCVALVVLGVVYTRSSASGETTIVANPDGTSEPISREAPQQDVKDPEPIDADSPKTDSAWTLLAIERLTDLGWNSTTVAKALSMWQSGHALSTASVEIVQAAISVTGRPPQKTYPIIRVPTYSPIPTPSPSPSPSPSPTPKNRGDLDKTPKIKTDKPVSINPPAGNVPIRIPKKGPQ